MIISKNWLQTYFENDLPSIEEIDRLLVAHSFETEGIEVAGDDHVIDIDVLPNRAHDCLCHEGIAKELGGLMSVAVKDTLSRYTSYNLQLTTYNLSVDIQNTTQCRRYVSRIIKNIEVTESPQWLQDRLAAMGQRPINNIVDATNYVLFDMGQPTHVFDLEKLGGTRARLQVRNAQKGEAMTTLSGEELTLDESMLVIASGDQVLALAGVKGGTAAEVDNETRSIVLEVANFEPISTRKTRHKTGLITDASKRFENELSPEVATEAMEALTRLIVELAGTDNTTVGEIVDVYPETQETVSVEFTVEHTNRLTGFDLAAEDIADILNRFGYTFTENNGTFVVTIPPRRYDLRIAEDMIEEIGRIHGYQNLQPQSVADIAWESSVNTMVYYQNRIRNVLISQGYSEILTYTFVKKGDIEMLHPLASDKKALRTNLHDGFARALDMNLQNAPLFGQDRIRGFEFGKVFDESGEYWHLVIGVVNKDKKARKAHGYPHEQLNRLVDLLNTELGTDFLQHVGEGESTIEIHLQSLVETLPTPESYGHDVLATDVRNLDRQYQPYSQYPFMVRDIALWAPSDVVVSDIEATIAEHATGLCQRIDLFDTYQPDGENRTSYAFSIIFQAMDRTLTDDEIGGIMDRVYAACVEKGWETR
jgi:phenylalanyl-tRNA synthetase beta chain